MNIDRLPGAFFWGLFGLWFGSAAAEVIDGLSGGLPRAALPFVIAASSVLWAAAGATHLYRLLPHAAPPARPKGPGDRECQMCGRSNPASATTCPTCGEPTTREKQP